MKKFLLVFFFALIFSIAYVSAAPNLNMPSSINLGEKSRNETPTATFTISNTGNVSLTNIIPFSDFGAEFNTTGFNLTVSQSAVIRFNTTILKDSPTGNITIGNIYFRSNEFNTSNFPVTATVKGGLNIDDLDVTLTRPDGKSKVDTDVTDGTKLDFGGEDEDEIRPGSTLQFDFEIENLFLDDEDIEIRDVSVLVTIKEIDDEEDIDEESENFDLKPEKKEDFTVTLNIPLKVKEGEYDIEILVRGKDEEGVEHKVEWDLKMQVEKESHDIYIETLYLSKDRLSCSRISSLKTKIFNLGKRDEDEVKIEAKNSDIGLNFVQGGINLAENPFDDDNDYEKTIPIVVNDDVKAGTYPIDFNVYIKGDILLKNRKIDLVIEDCKTGEETAEEVEEETNESFALEQIEGKSEITGESEAIPILGQETTVTEEKEIISAKTIILGSVAVTIAILIIVVVAVLLFRYTPKKII